MTSSALQLEICVDSPASLHAAVRGGADRVELCASLGEGGLTPSAGWIEQALESCSLPVFVLVRPRPGDFVYDTDEVECIVRDVRKVRELGAHGVVAGALRADGRVDAEFVQRVQDAAGSLPLTFHRAFDHCAEPLEALSELQRLGVRRVLTSGQAERAEDGAELLRTLVERAGDDVIVLPGGGVREATVAELVRQTGVREVHASASVEVATHATDGVSLGPAESSVRRVTSAERVAALRAALGL